MTEFNRRALIKMGLASAAVASLPASIARALAIPANNRTGTIKDVEHVVILMQENRSFDHYFGAMSGVRGFNDRFPIPVGDAGEKPRPVWSQRFKDETGQRQISPWHLDTKSTFELIRMEGTPHSWTDSQYAWDNGRMSAWPEHKTFWSMGYYQRDDIPFQYTLAETFTICDAYHCSIMSSTNPNRTFLWTGTNDPLGKNGGPVLDNSHDSFPEKGYAPAAYTITSYAERLQKAGVDWRIYKDMGDFFTNNPLVGIESYRDSYLKKPGSDPELAKRALSTHGLDQLKADVQAGTLPQVSYLISHARGSEHPSRSSPAQGAAYISDVLDALTANPEVWAKTALFIMFDENDGFFDHVPPPAPPSRDQNQPEKLYGASTVDLTGEYHVLPGTGGDKTKQKDLLNRPYGLGPRVPMYVISPWSRGGIVNSQVFDHTSVIRFLEARFGVHEPNITAWRRAVCGDLTSAFNFKSPNNAPFVHTLPDPHPAANQADTLVERFKPALPPLDIPVARQPKGVRKSSPLPYNLDARAYVHSDHIAVTFVNNGEAAAVFHVYDRLNLELPPHRYTVESGKQLLGKWDVSQGKFDLWILGPNSFHRHFSGETAHADWFNSCVWLTHDNNISLKSPQETQMLSAYEADKLWTVRKSTALHFSLRETSGWYDLTLTHPKHQNQLIRLAGRVENGTYRTTDPAN